MIFFGALLTFKAMQLTFKLFNIPVAIGLDFLIVVSILGLQRISKPFEFISWILVVFVSVLIHELGHAFAFRAFGRTPWIRFYSFGGLTGTAEGEKIKPHQDLVASLAGPASGLLFGGLCYIVYFILPRSELLGLVFKDLLWINIVWSLANLLPLFPLDGGRVAQIAIVHFFKTAGEKVFYVFSMAVAVTIACAGLYLQLYWIAIIAGFLVWNNLRAFRQLSQTGADRALYGELNGIYSLFKAAKYEDAINASERVFAKAVTPAIKNQAVNLAAWALYKLKNHADALKRLESIEDKKTRDEFLYGILLQLNGRYEEAKELLLQAFTSRMDNATCDLLFQNCKSRNDFDFLYRTLRIYPGAKVDNQLYASIAHWFHVNGKFGESADISSLRFSKFKDSNAAYNAACSKSRMGDKSSALRWLLKAAKAGFSDSSELERDPDLASLSSDPDFMRILETLRNKNA